MAKFREGEVVRSVLKRDEQFPFFTIERVYQGEHFMMGRGKLGSVEYGVIPKNNMNLQFRTFRHESALRHTEFDTAADE